MGKYWLISCLVLFTAAIALAAAAHSVVFSVTESGETITVVELENSATVSVPPDVADLSVTGGTATKVEGGFRIDTEDKATVEYVSSYHTRKEKGVWYFDADPGDADTVSVVLPQAVHVVQAKPEAIIVKEDSWQLKWEGVEDEITVSYVRVNQAQAAQSAVSRPRNDYGFVMFILFLIFSIAFIAWAGRSKKEVEAFPEEAPDMTEGQLNVIRAANKNEANVLTILLKHNGHIKRNKLEKESGLSKSSLASSLKNLEKKNLVIIDRTFFTHYIKITPWFAELS